MQEIKCPKCGEVFQVGESGYAAIVKYVRDKEFEKEIQERESVHKTEKDSAIKLAITKTESEKDREILEKELEIQWLRSEIELNKKSTDIAVKNAVQEKEKTMKSHTIKISRLANRQK